MKLPKNVQISPTSRGEIWSLVATPGGAHNAKSVQEAADDDTISGLLQERYELDPLTLGIQKKSHHDAMFKIVLSHGPMTVQQHMDNDSHIKQVLRMPATLTDVKKKQERIGSCTEHVAKFQKVNASVVLSPATSALVREIHAGNLAIIFDQHLGEATTLNLKFLCDWTAANAEFLKPFEFEDEVVNDIGEPTGDFKVTSVNDWFRSVLSRTRKTPILVNNEAAEVLREYKENGGGGGLLASKAHMMEAMLPAIGGAAEVKRLTQTSDRLGFLTSTHADNTFEHERIYRQMPSKTPIRTTSKQSPMPLDQQSPVNQPEFGEESSVQEMGATGEAGEEGAAAAHDDVEEELDPVELVPATGPLIVQVFVTQYLTNHGCGMIRWARSGAMKSMIDSGAEDGLVFEHAVGFKQISDQVRAIANKMPSFGFPEKSTFDMKFDAGLSAMLCAVIAGNAKLGMSIEASNIFQSSIATVSFKPDVILRRLAERADAWGKEPESIKKWSGYVKMMEFLPWFEYVSSVRLKHWQKTDCPSVTLAGEMGGMLAGLGASLFAGICGDEWKRLRGLWIKLVCSYMSHMASASRNIVLKTMG
eukprot:g19645.t1